MGDFSKKLLGIFLGISLSLGVGLSLSNSVHREAVGVEATSSDKYDVTNEYTFTNSSNPNNWTISSTNTHADKYLKLSDGDYLLADLSLIFGTDKELSSSDMKIIVSCGTFNSWTSNKSVDVSTYFLDSELNILSENKATYSSLTSSESAKQTAIYLSKPEDASKIKYLKIVYSNFTTGDTLRAKVVELSYNIKDAIKDPDVTLNCGDVDPTSLITNKTYSFAYECNELCGSNPTVIFEVEKDYASKIVLTQDKTAKTITINTGTALTADAQFNVVCYVLDESGDYLVDGKTFTFKVLMPTLTLSKEEVALRTEDEIEVTLSIANFDGDVTYSAKIDEGYPTNITYEISGNKLTVTGVSADETIIDITATDGTRTATAALYVTIVDKIVKGKTVQELIKQTSDKTTLYEVTAVVTNIDNTTYGNLYLKDSSISSGDGLYVYGCSATASAFTDNGYGNAYTFKNPQDYNSKELTKSIVVGSKITMYGIIFDYVNKSGDKTREMSGIVTKVVSPQEQADAFGTYFLNATSTACADVTTPDANKAAIEEIWANISAYYSNIDNLSDAARMLVKNATANNEGTDLEKAMARYDTIMNRYEASSNIIDNFIDRSTSSAQKSSIKANFNSNSLVLIISIVAFLSITSFGSYVFIRRRKLAK